MIQKFELKCWSRRLYRHGFQFNYFLKKLAKSRCLPLTDLASLQNRQLQRMIQHCYEHVPYYRSLFQSLKLKPVDFQTREDLQQLPLLDKKTVQENLKQFISKKYHNFLCTEGRTSGTTGFPSTFIRDFDSINFEHAAVWRHWRHAGDDGLKRIHVRGDMIVPTGQTHPPFWRYNGANKELQMSSFHLSLANSPHYIQKILDFKPDILYCGPSSGYLLASFFKHYGLRYPLSAIFTSSESLEPHVRETMEEVFDTSVYDWYGQAERVAAIAECKFGVYHIQEDYSLVELLPSNLTSNPQPSNHHFEIVGTQFHNKVMPLLRYATGDFVECVPDAANLANSVSKLPCACGSYFRRVERIMGRSYGYLLTPEGFQIAVTAHIPVGVPNIIETQFHQDKPGEVVVKILTNGLFMDSDRERLIQNTLKYTSPQMKVHIKEVSHIPRGANGKFVNIVNTL